MSLEAPDVATPMRRYRRTPLLVAALVGAVLLVGGAAFAANRLLGPAGATGPELLASHLPPGTLVYAELDLEPDGTQGAALDALNERLAAFGAGDGAARLLDPLLEGISSGEYRYSRDVRPWFDGRVAVAVLDWGSFGQLPVPFAPLPSDPVAPGTVLLFGVQDQAGAVAFTDRLRADADAAGLGFVSRERGAWTIWSAAPMGPGQVGIAYAIGEELLMVATRDADLDDLIALHDEGGENLAADESFRRELARLPAERVGTLVARAGSLPAGLLGAGLLGTGELSTIQVLASLLPLDQAGALVLADDRIIFERWQPAGGTVAQPSERQNDRLAAGFPANTVFYAELPEFGDLLNVIGSAIKTDASVMGGEGGAQEIARIESLLGRDLGSIGDWLGDLGIGLRADGIQTLGVVGEAADVPSAASFLGGLTELIGGSGVPVDQELLDGAPLVRLDVPFLFGTIQLEMALLDDRVVVGTDGFAEWVHAAPAGLGGEPSYASALEEVGGVENAGVAYLAVERIFDLMRNDPFMQPSDWAEVEPRLASVRDAIIATFVEGDQVRSRLEIRLADPN